MVREGKFWLREAKMLIRLTFREIWIPLCSVCNAYAMHVNQVEVAHTKSVSFERVTSALGLSNREPR